jgi:hypothetical protein
LHTKTKVLFRFGFHNLKQEPETIAAVMRCCTNHISIIHHNSHNALIRFDSILKSTQQRTTMAPQKKQKTGKKEGKRAHSDDERRSSRVLNEQVAVLNRENVLGQLTDEFLQEKLFPFLSINDTSNLSLTCRENHHKVSSTRSYPCIVWEGRFPTTMGYETRNEEEDRVTVTQLHRFYFLFRTNCNAQEESVQVEFSLQNEVWDEHLNMRDGVDCRGLQAFPSTTKVEAWIYKPPQNNQVHERLFVSNPSSWLGDGGVFLGEDNPNNDYLERDQDWAPRDKKNLETALGYLLIGAKQIATFMDGTAYPSAEFLMRSLPTWLHKHFPSSFDWDAETKDRTTRVEFSYRPARTLAEWRGEVPSIGDGIHEHELDAGQTRGSVPRAKFVEGVLPWYRQGYSWISSDNDNDFSSDEGDY